MTVADPSDDVRRAQPLPRRVLAGYAVGSLVPGAFGTVPGLLLLPYLTDTLGVAAGVAGLLVLLPKAWDVIVNPLAGRISDRRGDRRAFLLVAGVATGVLFAAMFAGFFRSGLYVAVAFLATVGPALLVMPLWSRSRVRVGGWPDGCGQHADRRGPAGPARGAADRLPQPAAASGPMTSCRVRPGER